MTRLARTRSQHVHGGMHADEPARVRLGASIDTDPDVLLTLADDPAVTVRAAVALNASAPAGADCVLARDSDERVRTLLARKLAALLPTLRHHERDRLQQHALNTLGVLVADEATRVRAAIADAVKDMPQAPRDLILRLAHDSEIPVSEPVTRLSPLLTTEDLLALLAAPPTLATAIAVAGRKGLQAEVAEALANGTDHAAIAALLANHSAAIREATLDALVARAADRLDWHGPLVRRPRLSVPAARALSDCVATHLLSELASRADLPHEVACDLQRRLHTRLQIQGSPRPRADPNIEEAMHAAEALAAGGDLDEAAVLRACVDGPLGARVVRREI